MVTPPLFSHFRTENYRLGVIWKIIYVVPNATLWTNYKMTWFYFRYHHQRRWLNSVIFGTHDRLLEIMKTKQHSVFMMYNFKKLHKNLIENKAKYMRERCKHTKTYTKTCVNKCQLGQIWRGGGEKREFKYI